jgi:hypothetical protein
MKLLMPLLLAGAVWAQDGARITYVKSFPNSVPAYVQITLDKAGQGEYREAIDDTSPLKFQLENEEIGQVLALAAKLEWFKRPLESGLNVAKMGEKTFRFEDGQAKNEVKFNFTQDPDGRALHEWFERIAESELNLINLQRVIRFDRLGLNQALLNLQSCYDRKRLTAPAQFLPLLDRVVKNESFMHMSRERAAALAEAIRAAKPKAE